MHIPGIAENLSIESSAPVQSVDRALRLVEILAGRQVAGVTELASVLGVHKSTASRLLSTLELHGIVEQDRGRGAYRLGAALTSLAGAVTGRVRLLEATHPTAERLAHEVGETVDVAVLDGDRVVNVDHIAAGPDALGPDTLGPDTLGPDALGPDTRSPARPDRAQPVHAASGKVLMAWLPEDEGTRLLSARPLLERTLSADLEPGAIAEELVKVREQGWSLVSEDHGPGLKALSAPIFDRDGAAIAALTVSGPLSRLPAERLAHVAVLTAERATEVSARLGYPGRPEAEPGPAQRTNRSAYPAPRPTAS